MGKRKVEGKRKGEKDGGRGGENEKRRETEQGASKVARTLFTFIIPLEGENSRKRENQRIPQLVTL